MRCALSVDDDGRSSPFACFLDFSDPSSLLRVLPPMLLLALGLISACFCPPNLSTCFLLRGLIRLGTATRSLLARPLLRWPSM